MAIENTASSDFDPRSSIVKSVFDCRLSGVVASMQYSLLIHNFTKVHAFLSCSDPFYIGCQPENVAFAFTNGNYNGKSYLVKSPENIILVVIFCKHSLLNGGYGHHLCIKTSHSFVS